MSIRIGTSKTITGFDSGTLWIYQNHSTFDKKTIQKLRAKGFLFPSYGIDSLKAVSITSKAPIFNNVTSDISYF